MIFNSPIAKMKLYSINNYKKSHRYKYRNHYSAKERVQIANKNFLSIIEDRILIVNIIKLVFVVHC